MPAPKYVIADLDGTIALNQHRQHWLDPEQHVGMSNDDRWLAFFASCGEDAPNNAVIETLRAYKASGYTIHILSGRSSSVKFITKLWLSYFNVPYDDLKMRMAGDQRDDTEVKWDMVRMYGRENVLVILDDRNKVVDMWREKGFNCFQVAAGPF